MLIIGVFLLALVVGVISTSFWVPEEDLGRGYFQTNALVVVGLLAIVIGLVAVGVINPWPVASEPGISDLQYELFSSLGVGLLYSGFVFSLLTYAGIWTRKWLASRVAAGGALLSLGAALWQIDVPVRFAKSVLTLDRETSGLATLTSETLALETLGQFSLLLSGLVLGWSLVTMLLGHWYLVAPKLDFHHLRRFSWVLTGLIVVRIFASLAAMGFAAGLPNPYGWQALTSSGGWAMFLWVRILWGLVGALLLAIMALYCARQQSNQSATGILYVVVVSVWIGEATALFLLAMTGVPV